MIQGLKVTIAGQELQQLCLARANYHAERAIAYESQVTNLEGAQLEGMNYSGGDLVAFFAGRILEASHQ